MNSLSKDLYTVKKLEENAWEVSLADEMHPVFKAHFEGNPLLPAFLQVDILGELLKKDIVKIKRSKFKKPIVPNDIVIYELVSEKDNAFKAKILKNSEVASEISIVCASN